MLTKHYYFAYGSNMNKERMAVRGLSFSNPVKGVMRGYRLAFNKKAWDHPARSYANIVFDPASHVEGVLYRLDDEHQIQKMDPFEGAPRLYSREIFHVETQQGLIPSWVYIANKATISDGLKPDQWYLEHLLAGREHLSESYYQKLTLVETNG
ncbi:gamma-glutamylcyclotransferase family protein [Litoribrevibacter euphylliae]|uniref:Gamma-glutamylcyclotransferase family protein n=1 Tax=Litoribrevibacter euphylliae TaxID=1834034 RepID=A0ABV7HB61_9GAMM